MVEKYRTHEICKFDYSEIGEYVDENHTDNPLRNDEIVRLLNSLTKENKQLKKSNKSKELEIVRLHQLADDMGGVLRELGIHDVYDKEQIKKVKGKIK